MYKNIPIELQRTPHWVMWAYEEVNGKPTKVPYTPEGRHASVTNPRTWSNFAQVLEATDRFDGIGFVLSKANPYAFIDLDHTDDDVERRKQYDIFAQFADTYAEISPSGKGLHIIAKASIPKGRKKSWLEIYSDNRFMTITGNVYNNKPITDCNTRFNNIYNQLTEREIYIDNNVGDTEETYTDEYVLETLFTGLNGDKWRDLWGGDWSGYYKSQSEADLAFVNVLCFYSRNREQIARLFAQSQLGERDKASRSDYINNLITKSFDRTLPQLNLDKIAAKVREISEKNNRKGIRLNLLQEFKEIKSAINLAEITSTKEAQIDLLDINANYDISLNDNFDELPEGIVKEIAKFVYQQSPRPIKEIAQVTALAFMSGVCGRSYNVSGTGLNAYYVLLAMSGLGKETMQKGIEKIINSILPTQPNADKFMGLSELVSGQGLLRYFNEKSECFITVQGEFANLMKRMVAQNAPSHMIVLKKMLLDLYNKSGYGNKLQGIAYSDSKNNIGYINSPALTLLGESVPEVFYQTLSDGLAEEGLISRLLIYEAQSLRPLMNYNHANVNVPEKLRNALQILLTNCLTLNSLNNVINVDMDDNVKLELEKYDVATNEVINSTRDDIKRQIVTRNHLKIMKMAALFAIGDNFYKPKISMTHFLYAQRLVTKSSDLIIRKYEMEEIGNFIGSQNKQMSALENLIGEIICKPETFKGMSYEMRKDFVIPHKLISEKLKHNTHYKRSQNMLKNSAMIIRENIYALIEQGLIYEVPKIDVLKKYNITGKVYAITDAEYFVNVYNVRNQ